MKPLKLILSGFGTYSNETVIDFEKLGNRGLYLITGDTGAGKTTIFDAICYALYGNPSGDTDDIRRNLIRDEKTIRSKYASEDTKTYVKLTFQLHNDSKQKYTIYRNPEYVRTSKRKSGGTAIEKKSVQLECPDGTVITKSNDVDNKIREIIGLDEKKFKQIVMIAQGEFRKVLTASTEERTEIFRDIFQTEKYRILQDRLMKLAKEANDEYEQLNSSIMAEIGRIICSESNEELIKLNSFISENRRYFSNLSEIIKCVEKIVSFDEKKYIDINIELNNIQSKLDNINIKVEQAKNLIELIDGRDKVCIEVKNAENQCFEYKAKYESKKSNKNKSEKISEEIIRIKEKIPIYKQLDILYDTEKKSEKNIKELEDSIIKANEEYLKNSNAIQISKKKLESLKNVEANIERCNGVQERLNVYNKNLNSLNDLLDRCLTIHKEFIKKKKEYISAQRIYETKQELYNNLERKFLNAQAGILAKDLKEGDKCPVCGSIHHPELAYPEDDVPTEDMVKKVESDKNVANDEMSRLSRKAGEINAIILELQKQIKDKTKELYSEDLSGNRLLKQVTDDILKVNTELDSNEKLLKQYKIDLNTKKQTEESLETLNKTKEELEIDMNKFNVSKVTEVQKLENIQKQIKDLNSNLKYATLDKATAAINQMQSEKINLEDELNKSKEDFENSEKYLEKIKERLIMLNEQINGKEKPDIEKITEEQLIILNQKKDVEEKNIELKARINGNKCIIQNLIEKGNKFDEAQKKYSALHSLSMTANATITGKEKIMLETYVQTEYFKRMLERANIRFLDMSGGKYEFIHSSEAENKRSKSGLEINIIDHTNNTIRSAKSLSGGESFMASLSLALGLADEVQSNAGGIQIDTMFIDEGFGSLDSKVLENAVSVLGKLGESNRLVGIISHVSELKERINKQIIVTKDRFGSSKVKIEI